MSSARKHKRRQKHCPILNLQVSGPLYTLLAGMTPAERDALVSRALRKYSKGVQPAYTEPVTPDERAKLKVVLTDVFGWAKP